MNCDTVSDGGGLLREISRTIEVGVEMRGPPHPRPLPYLRRSGFAQAVAWGEGNNGVIS